MARERWSSTHAFRSSSRPCGIVLCRDSSTDGNWLQLPSQVGSWQGSPSLVLRLPRPGILVPLARLQGTRTLLLRGGVVSTGILVMCKIEKFSPVSHKKWPVKIHLSCEQSFGSTSHPAHNDTVLAGVRLRVIDSRCPGKSVHIGVWTALGHA